MANEEAKLFVAGLPDSISEDVLKQLFEATGGKVIGVSLPKDRMTGRPRGFGFVTLSTPAEAQAARDALDGSMQAGRSISVRTVSGRTAATRRCGRRAGRPAASAAAVAPRPARSRRRRRWPRAAPDRTLYVGESSVRRHARRSLRPGQRRRGRWSRPRPSADLDADGRKRGFGFVTMSSAESAKTAADALRTADLRGRRLVVNLAHPKGERPARPDGGGGGGFAGGGGGFGGPPAFGRRRPGGPTHRKPAHEERRKRAFEDGGGPRKKRGQDDHRGGGGGGRVDYDKDDD